MDLSYNDTILIIILFRVRVLYIKLEILIPSSAHTPSDMQNMQKRTNRVKTS